MPTPLIIEKMDGIAVLTVANPPANYLDRQVRESLLNDFRQVVEEDDISLIIITGKGPYFSMGVDVSELDQPSDGPSLADVCAEIENCTKPVIAALQGDAFGAGAELALACHFRVAKKGARFGFPDVRLGMPPCAGGTQRLPRLVGADLGLKLLLSGQPVTILSQNNMFDEVFGGNFHLEAFNYARRLKEAEVEPRRTIDMQRGLEDAFAYQEAITRYRAESLKNDRLALREIIRCVEAAALLPAEAALALEHEAYEDCLKSSRSVALRHGFVAEQRLRSAPEMQSRAPVKPPRIAIIGGSGQSAELAALCMLVDMKVTLVEMDEADVEASRAAIVARLDEAQSRGILKPENQAKVLGNLTLSADLKDCLNARLVIEDTMDTPDVKHALFKALGRIMPEDAVLATGQSRTDMTAMAESSGRQGNVVGFHFARPLFSLRVMEIALPEHTTDTARQAAFSLARSLRKAAVPTGTGRGFVLEALKDALRSAAEWFVMNGVSVERVDAALRDFGYALGPWQQLDMDGLDRDQKLRVALASEFPKSAEEGTLRDRLVEAGLIGRRVGHGLYGYVSGEQSPAITQDTGDIVVTTQAEFGGQSARFTNEEIQYRCLLALANRGATLLERKTAVRPSDVDLLAMMGFGFPREFGGPMHAADVTGLLRIRNDLSDYAGDSPIWAPSPLFDDLIKNGRSFDALNHDDLS
jgi:3-hydroxyacyl-CoA dehydrogenase